MSQLRFRLPGGILLVMLTAAPAAAQAPLFKVHVEKDVPVAMRDGVKLATDVYRPARDGKPVEDARPVILTRTPYDKAGGALALDWRNREGEGWNLRGLLRGRGSP